MTALTEAVRRARGLYPRSRVFQSVYLNGARAAVDGRPVDDCPYMRTTRGSSWARSYRAAWLRGYSAHRSGR